VEGDGQADGEETEDSELSMVGGSIESEEQDDPGERLADASSDLLALPNAQTSQSCPASFPAEVLRGLRKSAIEI
jgi:hypothetical protein